ncbi:protocadherin alpha-4-like [Ciona intestinalis]
MSVFLLVLSVVTSLLTSSCMGTTGDIKIVHLAEESSIGTTVANAVELMDLGATTTTFKLFSQKLLTPNPTPARQRQNWLIVDPNTGSVVLQNRVDREKMCGDSNKCGIHLQVFAVKEKQLMHLNVVIDDINDNPPVFPSKSIMVNISESAAIHDVISLDRFLASDADIGNNSQLKYSISENDFFMLEQLTDETNTMHLQLKLLRKLDYERNSFQRLTLSARDRGVPIRSSHVQLRIRVTDDNDNDPIFEQLEYSVTLLENLPSGHVIARVQAHDADSGAAGRLRYSISRRNKATARNLVNINELNGDVVLRQKLDREFHNGLRVLIEARDSTPTNQRIGRTWLVIRVDDVNDNIPVISVNYILTSEENTVYVKEDAMVGSYIAYVTAKDDDSGINGEVTLRLGQSSTDDVDVPFELTDEGFIGITGELDREDKSRYVLMVRACDLAVPPQCSTQGITVVLLDVNDHTPTFPSPKINLMVKENAEVGTIITTFHAEDDDAVNPPSLVANDEGEIVPSTNGDVRYSTKNNDGTFSIEPRSGKLSLVRPLDRETVHEYKITVIAKDGGGSSALQSTCELMLTVTDVNDNSPFFTNPIIDNKTVYATILRDDVIMRIQAVDYDNGRNGEVKYRIVTEDGSSWPSLFMVDAISGDLRLNMSRSNLAEELGIHTIVVEAQDNGTPSLSVERTIQINVMKAMVLPTVLPTGTVKPTFSYFIIIIGALAAFLFILILVIVGVVMKCRNNRKQARTYSCRKGSMESNEWCRTSVSSMRPNLTLTIKSLSREGSVGQGSAVWSQTTSNRNDSFNKGSLNDVTIVPRNDVMNRSFRSSSKSLCRPLMASYDAQNPGSKNFSAPHLPTLSHDGDSGRGDSDPDAASCDATYEQDFYKVQHNSSVRSRNNSREMEYGQLSPNCSAQCLEFGHSDTCWMPSTSQGISTPQPPAVNPPAPLYVELCPPTSRHHHYYNNPDTTKHQYNQIDPVQNLETIHEAKPLRHYWPYPASELSSIYSNAIVNSNGQYMKEAYGMGYNIPPMRQPLQHPRDFLLPPPDLHSRLSPISSLSSVTSPTSEVSRRSHYVTRREVEPETAETRSTTSLSTPSSPSKSVPAMPRSASADILAAESEPLFHRDSAPWSPENRNRKSSVRETENVLNS